MSKPDEPQVPASAGKPAEESLSLADKAKLLAEGVDFIENEGDVVAVESAALKIQSTFRGKKIRSKLGGAKQDSPAPTTNTTSSSKGALSENKTINSNLISASSTNTQSSATTTTTKQQQPIEDSLSKELATMQVNDNKPTPAAAGATGGHVSGEKLATSPTSNLPEDVAATKIQAGFKGYKTRKELAEEGKLAGTGQATTEHHEANK